MSASDNLRQQVRDELQLASVAAAPVLTVCSEADLQALVKLIREMGSNPLLADQLQGGVGRVLVQVVHGNFDGCACDSDHGAARGAIAAKPVADAGVKTMHSALGGLVTLARIQAANIPKGSVILLDEDAIVTPQVRDWMRQNKVQAQRSEV
jgi:hypothetical protein